MTDDIYITGIGASAGGTAALKTFFENIPEKPDTAFIIIQHLDRKQKGFTREVLSPSTSLPITQVEKRTKITKNHIYLIPPKYYILLEDHYLILEKRHPEEKINTAINTFFTSLALHTRDKAIAIILSGLGSDGAKGSQYIKEQGGMVMVQSPDSATYNSMPLEAIISDRPDVIGPPEKLAKDLIYYINQPAIIDKVRDRAEITDMETVQKIISLINEYCGVNFRDYKLNTILRRIDKRVKINYLKDPLEYFNLLTEKPDEIRTLYHDLLIGVTEFFRDSEAYAQLKHKVFPTLCHRDNNYSNLRIWVAACSTGEEAYSLAMLLDDYVSEHNLRIDFKIFATDLSQKAISFAGRGHFSSQIKAQMPPHLLKKYFIKKGDKYEVINDLRKKITFSVHNLMSDPPFIRLDLVTCRNMFIYLKEEVQKKLLYTFNYALKEPGYLMIGANESISNLNDVFETVDLKWKIFKNKRISKNYRSEAFSVFNYNFTPRDYTAPVSNKPVPSYEQEFYADLLIEKYAPDCILISDKNEVLYSSGKIEKYLDFPKRRSNLHLFDMVTGNISLALRNGLRKLSEEQRDVMVRNVVISSHNSDEDTQPEMIDLKLVKLHGRNNMESYILIEFNESQELENEHEFLEIASRDSIKEIERLEAELYQAKKELQYNSDELEAINEELQSSNEEMKSSNEEMQTTNEELQSTNEELKTVNQELKNKIDELTILHDDVNNLFVSTQIATIFLDRDLRIRKFTPAVQRYINVREGDVGRPIYHYTYNFSYDELREDVNAVLTTLQPIKREIQEKGYATMKIIPYKTDDMRIEGVIITFIDITELKEANIKLERLTEDLKESGQELQQSENYWKTLVENSPDIICRLNKNGDITFVNNSIYKHTGVERSRIIGKNLMQSKLFAKEDEINELRKQLDLAFKHKKQINYYQNFSSSSNQKHFFITLLPEQSVQNNKLESVLLVGRDISNLRDIELRIEDKNRKLEELNQYMDNFVHAVAHDLRSPLTNLKLILELIEGEKEPEKLEFLINRLGRSVGRIDDILNGLIEIIGSQKRTGEHAKKINFQQVIKKVIEQLNNELPKDAEIKLDIKEETIVHTRGYLYSIIRNLLSNAIKYRADHRPLVLKISTRQEGEYIVMDIGDNGIGMDFEVIKHDLFKPFKRFTSKADGKGIGLHIIKSMIEKTGGKIEVSSDKGKGTTFSVYFKNQ